MNKRKANISDFINKVKNKKLFCYGAGKVFEDFLSSYPEININAVIDKNASDTYINTHDKIITVMPLESFIKEVDRNSILLITCFDYTEVEKELENRCELDKLPYYVYCKMTVKDNFNDNKLTGRYQIVEFRMQDYNAGHKAPLDVATIAVDSGYKALPIVRGTMRNGKKQTETEWINACDEITDNSLVLIQYPISDSSGEIYRINNLKTEKNIKIICVIHDIEILRRNITESYIEQYEMLRTMPDVWIVHNNKMKEILISRGFPNDRVVSLEIFDYLIESPVEINKDNGIIIAGNLDIAKSEYIYHLNEISDVTFNLFGANYSDYNNYNNINYFGTFLPEELIKNLQGRYGLVWDGDSLDTCSGLTGEYLKVNNPHKLSLYLAVGLPVIIWSEAAEAEFVRKNNVGLTISSLYELPVKLAAISESDYEIMKNNAMAVGKHLRKGEYMMKAIKKAEKIIQEIRNNESIQ